MYLRLSRDDESTRGGFTVGNVAGKQEKANLRKAESNSIGNQRELIRAFIHGQQDIELYDCYVDDSAKIGLNQKNPYSKGDTLILVLFLF